MDRLCKPCGERHQPPTGVNCRKKETLAIEGILEEMKRLSEKVSHMETRISNNGNPINPNDRETGSGDLEMNERRSISSPIVTPETPSTSKLSVSTLQADSELQERVRHKMRTIAGDESSSDSSSESESDEPKAKKSKKEDKKGKKSGRSRTANDKVVKEVDWPHLYVYKGQNRKPAAYEDLTLAEFSYGVLCQITSKKTGKKTKEHLLLHLKDLLEDTMEYGFDGPKSFHAALLTEFEQDRMSWGDEHTIQRMRMQYSQKTTRYNPNKRAVEENDLKDRRICSAYSNGYCKEDRAHKSAGGMLLHHICAKCYNSKGLFRRHSQSQCPQYVSKN